MSAALPAPENRHDARDDDGQRGRRREPFILSMQQVLAALSAVPRMVKFGLLTKDEAGPIIASLKALLDHYHKTATAGSGAGGKVGREQLLEVLKQQPHLLDIVAPLFDDETLAMLRRLLEEGN